MAKCRSTEKADPPTPLSGELPEPIASQVEFGQLITSGEVMKLLRVSRSTLWRIRRHDSTFPRAVALPARATRFVRAEILAWIEAKRAAKGGPAQ